MERNCEHCIIKQLNSFKALNKDELKRLSKSKKNEVFKKGTILFEEGTKLNGVYCIQTGKCKVTKLAPNGNEQIIRFIKRGELIGHRSLLSEESTHLTVTALDDVEACFIPKQELDTNLEHNEVFAKNVTKSLCIDLDNANTSITNLAQKNVKERLAESLLFFEKTFGVDDDGFLNIHLSREEIANSIGTATESCIRLLSQFKKENLVELKGKKIKLLNKVKLQHIAESY